MIFAARSPLPARHIGFAGSLVLHAAICGALLGAVDNQEKRISVPAALGETVLIIEMVAPPTDGAQQIENTSGARDEMMARSHAPAISETAVKLPAGRGTATIEAPATVDASREASKGLITTDHQREVAPPSGAEAQRFRTQLLRHIERFRRYPQAARRASLEGSTQVQFAMDHSGQVIDVWVELSSGSSVLDDEAIAAVLRAQPLPTPPTSWPSSVSVTLPITYALR